MNFVQWLTSLDELLYEVMSWLVFLPVTLWRIVTHPLATMAYAEEQLKLEPEAQYRDTISPPITLVLAIVIAEGLGISVDGANPVVTSRVGLRALVTDNTTLALLRVVLFGLFALVLATRKVNRSDQPLDRDTLKALFYAQCYAAAPFALVLGVGTVLGERHMAPLRIAGYGSIALVLLFYGVVQVRWFSRELGQSHLRSFYDASLCMIASIASTVLIGVLFA